MEEGLDLEGGNYAIQLKTISVSLKRGIKYMQPGTFSLSFTRTVLIVNIVSGHPNRMSMPLRLVFGDG